MSGAPLPRDGRAIALRALDADAEGDWDAAHDLVAALEDDSACAWVHAYLHRQEGDLDNARYWYGRAGRPEASGPLAEEARDIAQALKSESAE
jgi:hypothetical protein